MRACWGGGQQTWDAYYNHQRQCDGKAPFTKLQYSRFSIIPPAKTSYLKQKQHMLPATRKKEGYLLCCLRVRVGVRKERGVLAVLPRSFCIQLPFFEQLEKFVRSLVAPSDSGCLRRAWGSNRRGSQNPKARLHNDKSPGGSIKDGGSNRRGGYTSLMGN